MESQSIVTTIIASSAAIIGAVATLITSLKNKSLKKENKTLNKEITEIKLLSSGMAVAYVYSFIEPLFRHLQNPLIKVKDNEGVIYDVEDDRLKLQLYIPNSFNIESMDNTKSMLRSISKECVLVNEEQVVFRNLRFRIEEHTKKTVIIMDLPNTLDSVLKFYQPGDSQNFSEETLRDLQKEIDNFCMMITDMVNKRGSMSKKVEVKKY